MSNVHKLPNQSLTELVYVNLVLTANGVLEQIIHGIPRVSTGIIINTSGHFSIR